MNLNGFADEILKANSERFVKRVADGFPNGAVKNNSQKMLKEFERKAEKKNKIIAELLTKSILKKILKKC